MIVEAPKYGASNRAAEISAPRLAAPTKNTITRSRAIDTGGAFRASSASLRPDCVSSSSFERTGAPDGSLCVTLTERRPYRADAAVAKPRVSEVKLDNPACTNALPHPDDPAPVR